MSTVTKVRVGIDNDEIGTIAWRDGRFVVAGNTAEMRGIIRRLQGDREPTAFLASLPKRLGTRYWAVAVPQPARDEEGD